MLDNGLTVLVREDRSAPVVALVTYVKAGYFDEPDDVVGISHVLEHMFFKGTPTRGPGEIAQETKAAGGYLNAATIYDHTTYYTVLPSSSFTQGLDIQSDALLNSVIDAEELRKELLVIIQEARRKLDNPGAVAQETLYQTMFDRHRMRRWRIGVEEQLATFTSEQVRDFYRGMYRASSIVLVVAGDVHPERAFAEIEQRYAKLDSGPVVRDYGPEEPREHGFRFHEITGDIVQAHLELGWHTPDALHPDAPALDLLAVILGQGRASRLYREVRERGLVNSIIARHYTPTILGVFGVSAELDPANTVPALDAIAGALRGVQQNILPEELERARTITQARMARRLESMEGQANHLAEWEALGDWKLAADYLDRIGTLTAREIRDVAERYLAIDSSATLLYRPAQSAPIGLSVDALQDRLRAAAGAMPAPASPVRAEPPRRQHPKQQRREDEIHFFELEGARVVVKPRRNAPLVTLSIAHAGGLPREPVELAGITSLMLRTSVKGTRNRSAEALALEAESLGATISPSSGSDLFDWSISVPSNKLERAVELLADAAFSPQFPESEFEKERAIALRDLEQVRDDMFRFPFRLFMERAWGDHPYGYSIERTEAGVSRLTADDLRRWHNSQVVEPLILVVGDVDADRAAEDIARWLLAPSDAQPIAALPAPAWPDTAVERVSRRDRNQTALVVGLPGPDRNHDDVYALQVMSNAIAGLGGRLFEELRSRQSLAYTVTAYPMARRDAGAFVGYIATSPSLEEQARDGLIRELRRTTEELIPDDEVERARRYTIGTWKIRQQTNGAQLGELEGALLVGQGLSELREFEQRIREVTPQMIRDAAQRWFDFDRMVYGAVRGQNK